MTLVKRNLTVILACNPLERDTWERFESYSDLCQFLLSEVAPRYNGHFPQSGKIYHENIDQQHDITPATPVDAEALAEITGLVYVVIWPAAQAVAVQAAVYVGMFLATTLLKKLIDTPDEKVTSRNLPKGSPNNLPGQRKNVARVLQRIPDIYGRVKCTPDLIQYPYIAYENNLQTEIIVAVIGRGEYSVNEDEIFEASTRVSQIPGMSLAIYGPSDVPVTDSPQLQIGPVIEDPLLTVIPVREVTGEQVLAPNNTVIWGDDDEALSADLGSDTNVAALFGYPSTGVGEIVFMYSSHERTKAEEAEYFTNRLNVGDKFGLDWTGNATSTPTAMKARGAVSIHRNILEMGAGGDANIPDLSLLPDTTDDDCYEVTGVDVVSNYGGGSFAGGPAVVYTISVPASKQSEWDKIILFNPTQVSPTDAPVGYMFNRMSIIYVLNYRLGPFFCNDPNMEEIHFNFIADKGLWVDDGRRQKAYGSKNIDFASLSAGGIEVIVELTPADEDGIATGSKESHSVTMFGSATRRDFIGNTFKITPSFTGRFLVSVYRNTLQYWRSASNSYSDNNQVQTNWDESPGLVFGERVLLQRGQWMDDIKWTHCYSVSAPKYYPFTSALTSLGNVTLVHAKTTQVKYAPQREFEKNLNMIVTRVIDFWDGTEYGGSGEAATTRGLDAAFHVMTDYYLGNIDEDNIDFDSIVQAFDDVFQAFGDSEATQFSHTFDDEQSSFEDILSAIGESCFVTFYRQGNVIKALADVSKVSSSLIFNHRNMVADENGVAQTRHFSFGTEEDYDGVEIEYQDNSDNQLKTYVAPLIGLNPRNPQKIRVAGVRSRAKAAMHAWRVAHRLQYQNMVAEFDSCEEAALSIIKDKVLIADTTNTLVQDGEIVRIDGLTVYTSQEVNVSPSLDYTLFIQDVDGSVQAIPVVTDSTKNGLVLDGAPSDTLVIDTDTGIYPRYMLVSNQDSNKSAFHIKEAQYKNRGVYSVIATNYSEGFYFYDALRLWLVFNQYNGFPPVLNFYDRSAYELDFEEVGAAMAAFDVERGVVYQGPDSTSALVYPDFRGTVVVDYTVAFWVNFAVFGGILFRSEEDSATALVFQANALGNEFRLFHDSVEYATMESLPTDEWNHIGIVYDFSSELVTFYLNGEQHSQALDVPGFDSFDGLRVFEIEGMGDDFRFYNKPKSAEFMRALYQKSLNPPF